MRGFIFTIDSMMSLLFAFFIISIPVQETGPVHASDLPIANVALIHQHSHQPPLTLLNRIGMCGEYTLYDSEMHVKKKELSCNCNTDINPYYYPYIGEDGLPYLVSIRACKGEAV